MDSSQYNQKITALFEVGKKLSAGIRLSEPEIFDLIYQQASERLEMKSLSIALYDEVTDTVRFVLAYADGRQVDVEREEGWETRTGADGKTEEIIHTKKFLYVPTLEEAKKRKFHPKYLPNSWLGVPMMVSKNVLGVIATYHYGQDNFYEKDDIQILLTLADMAAIAIQNLRLYNEHTKRTAELSAAYEVSKATYQVENLKDFYEKIHAIVQELMPSAAENNFYIVLYDSDTEKYSLPYFKDEYDDELPVDKIEGGLAGYVISKGIQLLLGSPEEREQFLKEHDKIRTVGKPSKSWLGVPLKASGKIIGVLVVKSYSDNIRYGKSEEDILGFISEQIAMAIERVRAEEELRKHRDRLEERTKQLENLNHRKEVLIKLAQKLTSAIQLNEDGILRLIYENATELMDTSNMYIALYDEKTDIVRFGLAYVEGTQINVNEDKRYKPRSGGMGKTEAIIRDKKSLFHPTWAESDAWYNEPGHKEYTGKALPSWMGVPVIANEKVLGVVATYNESQEYVYTKDDLEILQAMADIAAIALNNAKLVNDLKDAQEGIANRERELVKSGIAMDFIHKMNNLAGTIPAWISLIKRKLKSESNPDSKIIEYLDKINQDTGLLLNEANELRKPISEPEKIDMEEVVGAIVAQVEMMVLPDIKIIFNDPEDDLFPVYGIKEQIAVAIYSVIQNGVKAISGRGKITVDIKNKEGKYVEIDISDTGCGISQDKIDSIFEYGKSFWTDKKGTGYGLWRARSIIQSMKGNIKVVNTKEGEGTTFTITLPIE